MFSSKTLNPANYSELLDSSTEKYLVDHIHPNASHGIQLYSEKFIAPEPN